MLPDSDGFGSGGADAAACIRAAVSGPAAKKDSSLLWPEWPIREGVIQCKGERKPNRGHSDTFAADHGVTLFMLRLKGRESQPHLE
ncbi:hypothetical protein CPLU01_13191 [Colletotrichum plurivorum]|uniref:Uncharacterized protein n=1 Tax=Colletotrichum plurivorum TaxID=2175906 RepID=A0A8H6JU26_9PEZI|nr:hypothetical protein CPLU01_13191 [Colletotrichum plurivorum]